MFRSVSVCYAVFFDEPNLKSYDFLVFYLKGRGGPSKTCKAVCRNYVDLAYPNLYSVSRGFGSPAIY